jgi:E1A/CREB-binding protein
MLDDGSEIRKSKLVSAKHDSLPEEAFIECHDCSARVHQICALYNGRKAKPNEIFRCLKCILVQRESDKEPDKVWESAKELPKCKMSDFIEEGLLKTLDKAYENASSNQGISLKEVEKAEGISVRVMSHVQKKHTVRDEVRIFFAMKVLLVILDF